MGAKSVAGCFAERVKRRSLGLGDEAPTGGGDELAGWEALKKKKKEEVEEDASANLGARKPNLTQT